jgi:SulP family sulfate permease
MLHQEAHRLRGQGRTLCLRRAKTQVVEELLKLEGAEKCPIEFQPPV